MTGDSMKEFIPLFIYAFWIAQFISNGTMTVQTRWRKRRYFWLVFRSWWFRISDGTLANLIDFFLTFMEPCIAGCVLYNQRDAIYTMFFIIISALHVSGGFSAHHQELIKPYVQSWVLSCFPAVYRWWGWVVTVQLIYIQFYKLLTMGGKTVRNV
jgi:hypothetical protein